MQKFRFIVFPPKLENLAKQKSAVLLLAAPSLLCVGATCKPMAPLPSR